MVSPNEFIRGEINVLSRGFIPPEEVAAAERQPLAMVRSRISWGSVIGGGLLTLGLLILSSALALACGVPAFSGEGPYGLGAGVWSVLSAIIAFGCGGWLSACLTSAIDARYRVLHGVLLWALVIPLIALLHEGGIVGGILLTRGGSLLADVHQMVITAPRVGPAWGAFLAMALGLVASICGGAMVDLVIVRKTTATSKTPL